MIEASNPILPGFHPDPSVCRVGEDFYLVTSTFAYFPGIPVYQSRDLATWKQIGNVLDRPEQLHLDGAEVSQGIFAATIRHHRGTFYVITTNVGEGNFLVTATDPTGPWSNPVWLPDAPGIDPSLYFENDRVWYCGTRPRPEGPQFFGDWEVWIQELDPKTWTFVDEARAVWRGALRNAVWPEGPHLYRKDGWYYLLAAEGGTERHHAVTVARSRELIGPWEGNPTNPILTHRNLGQAAPIVNVGHADLFDAPDGSWWMVVLGSRPFGGPYCNLGRETFLVPVGWEEDWPVANPGVGRVECRVALPGHQAPVDEMTDKELFDKPRLGFDWMTIRTPEQPGWDQVPHPGHLRLPARAVKPGERKNLSFVGKRRRHPSFEWTTDMEFSPDTPGGSAGMMLFMSDDFCLRFERARRDGVPVLQVVAREAGNETILAWVEVPQGRLTLEVRSRFQNLDFAWIDRTERRTVAEGVDGRFLSPERAGGFVGTVLALFATGGGRESQAVADFSSWTYRALPDSH